MLDVFTEIVQTIKRNKLRTALTGFAVSWGIFILILLLSATVGLTNGFSNEMNKMSVTTFKLYPGATSIAYSGFNKNRNIDLKNSDINNINNWFNEIVGDINGTIKLNDVIIKSGTDYTKININGVYANYSFTEPIEATIGRLINNKDINECRKVIVISEKYATILFGTGNKAMGRVINVDEIAYLVVGIAKNNINDEMTDAFIPFTTMQNVYGGDKNLSNISFITRGLEDEIKNENFEKGLRANLSRVHKYNSNDYSAVWIWNIFSQYTKMNKALSILNIAMWIVGLFTLLSGIVGVNNIMFISVKERTHEIGIRRALGARPHNILLMIILESIIITSIFGYLGMVLGIAIINVLSVILQESGSTIANIAKEATIGMDIGVKTIVILIITGALAGIYPANKALKVAPIEALEGK